MNYRDESGSINKVDSIWEVVGRVGRSLFVFLGCATGLDSPLPQSTFVTAWSGSHAYLNTMDPCRGHMMPRLPPASGSRAPLNKNVTRFSTSTSPKHDNHQPPCLTVSLRLLATDRWLSCPGSVPPDTEERSRGNNCGPQTFADDKILTIPLQLPQG